MRAKKGVISNSTDRYKVSRVLTDGREQGTPCNAPHGVLDLVNAPGGASEQEQLDIVDDQRHGLQDASGSASETLQDDVGQEERRSRWQFLREEGGDRARIVDETGECLDETAGDSDDQEGVLREKRMSARPQGEIFSTYDNLEDEEPGHQR